MDSSTGPAATTAATTTPAAQPRRPLLRRPLVQALLAAAVVAAAVGLWAFEPWRLWTSSTVDEALPTAAAPAGPVPPPGAAAVPPAAPVGPVVLGEGAFVSQEHETTGRALVVELADGARVLRFEDFSTSDGPDLHVWLTDQPAGAEWGSYDDGRYVELADLKATGGNQNYPVPADVDLAGLTSVVVWCDRFSVAFGSAPLTL